MSAQVKRRRYALVMESGLSLGVTVLSWHRWYWQAYKERERRGIPQWKIYTNAEVHESWDRADALAELRREEARRLRGVEATREFVQAGPSTDLDGVA